MSKKMGCDIAMNSGRMHGKLGAIPDVSRNVFESPKKKRKMRYLLVALITCSVVAHILRQLETLIREIK